MFVIHSISLSSVAWPNKLFKKILFFSVRFYLELRKDPHGPELALFIGNLPANLSHKQYETILLEFLDESKLLNVYLKT